MATLIEHIHALASRIANEIKSLKSEKLSNNGTGETLRLNNWFRSTGDTGWYNETYGGGLYMSDQDWVRVFWNKRFFVDNQNHDAIFTTGGVKASLMFKAKGDRWRDEQGLSFNQNRFNEAPFALEVYDTPPDSFLPIITGVTTTASVGFMTRVKLGILTGTGNWAQANLMVASAESVDHPMFNYTFDVSGIVGAGAVRASLPQLNEDGALTRKDYVDSLRIANLNSPNHSFGDANSHYNNQWDGYNVENAPLVGNYWFHFREQQHSAGAWFKQEASHFHSDEEYFRRALGNTEQPWVRRWNSSNLIISSGTFIPYVDGLTSNVATGHYDRVGNIVHFTLFLDYQNIGSNDGVIRGLPFVFVGDNSHYATAQLYMTSALSVLPEGVNALLTPGSAQIQLINRNQTAFPIMSNQNIIISGSYRVA